jgi:uncharacterized protein involved in exopolysaccharide biosynthesis
MPNLTLDDLARTSPTARRILQEHEASQAKVDAEVEAKRAADLAGWQATITELAPAYLALRAEILKLLGELAPRVGPLVELRAQLHALAGFIRKNDGQVTDLPEPTTTNDMRKAVDAARDVAVRLAHGL